MLRRYVEVWGDSGGWRWSELNGVIWRWMVGKEAGAREASTEHGSVEWAVPVELRSLPLHRYSIRHRT